MLRSTLVAAIIATGLCASAHAQSCTRISDRATGCRFLLSESATVEISSRAYRAAGPLSGHLNMVLRVDDHTCFSQDERPGVVYGPARASCRLRLGPGDHRIIAEARSASGEAERIGVQVKPDAHLAALPAPAERRRLKSDAHPF